MTRYFSLLGLCLLFVYSIVKSSRNLLGALTHFVVVGETQGSLLSLSRDVGSILVPGHAGESLPQTFTIQGVNSTLHVLVRLVKPSAFRVSFPVLDTTETYYLMFHKPINLLSS